MDRTKSEMVGMASISGVLFFSLFFLTAADSASLYAETISPQTAASRRIADEFMTAGIELRLGYEYGECFLRSSDQQKLLALAQKASLELQKIYESLRGKKEYIENYEGDDWEKLYGVTGLWRKIFDDAQQIRWFKCRIDYFVALASEPERKGRILRDIIADCESLDADSKQPEIQLIKALALMLLAGSDIICRDAAGDTVETILQSCEPTDEIYFEAAILKFKLEGSANQRLLDSLTAQIVRSGCRDNFELNLKLAFLQSRLGNADLLAKVLTKWPTAENFVGEVILLDAAGRLNEKAAKWLKDKSVFEIELAVKAAHRSGAAQYRSFLKKACGIEKFQTALVFYVSAEAHRQCCPDDALEYYILAAMARQQQPGESLPLEAVQIARQAAGFGYELYCKDPQYRKAAKDAVSYYCTIAGRDVDRQIQYLYAGLLEDDGRSKKAVELLKKISLNGGEFSKEATFDLIVRQLRDTARESKKSNQLRQRLKDLIDSADGNGQHNQQITIDAVRLYCQLTLENRDEKSAREVLEMLEKTADSAPGGNLNLLRAEALQMLGRLDEAAEVLTACVKPNSCEAAGQAAGLLTEVLPVIDEYQSRQENFGLFIENCRRLADYCVRCADEQQKDMIELIWAEIEIFAADGDKKRLAKVEEVLSRLSEGSQNNLEMLRCRARLLMAKGDFAEAAGAWAALCRAWTDASASAMTRPRRWWWAKFYEIYCWSKLPQTSRADIEHAVEVLQSSFMDIPSFWAGKIKEIKTAKLEN